MHLKNHKYQYYLFFFLAFADIVSIAQPTLATRNYRHFTTNQGLSNNLVSSLIQDKYGFIWIGTSNGLNRFDGYDFVQYKNRIGDTGSLSNNFIRSLFLDSKGFIWIATNNGLNRFDPQTETFKHYRHQPADSTSIANNQVSFMYEDKEGYLWLGAFRTLDRLNMATGVFTHYTLPQVGITGESLTIEGVIGYDNDIFVSVWGVGVYRFNRSNKQFRPVSIIHNIKNNKNWLHHFYIDKKGDLLATDGSFMRYNAKENAFRFVDRDVWDAAHLYIGCIAEISKGKYITGTTGNGFNVYGSGMALEGSYLLDKDTSLYLNNNVQEVLTARSGEVWFGMAGNGLFEWDTNLKKFDANENIPGNLNSILTGPVSSIFCMQNGNLLLGSRLNGFSLLDAKTQSFTHFYAKNAGLNVPYVRTVFEDRQRNKWIGTWGGGLNRIDANTGAFSYFKTGSNPATSLQDNFVTALAQSADNKIWVTTTRGLSVIDTKNPKEPVVKGFVFIPGSTKCPSGLRTDALLCDHNGNIWIGSEANGLSRYNPVTDTFDYFDYSFNDTGSLGSNKINMLFEDSKQRLWVACSGGGLNLFLPEKKSFVHYTEREGLPGNEVRGIAEDNNGMLWVTTDKGISQLDIKNNTFKNYNADDGLLSNQFYPQSIAKSHIDGRIYAGTTTGLVSFYPDSILSNKFIPPVYIISFKKYLTLGKQTTTAYISAIEHQSHVELDYNENTFTLKFASLNYSNSEKNQYAYQLQGLNNNWVALGTTRELTFSNLPPGNYTLHIKASNSDLVWNEKGTVLTIKIWPPWWRSWWAYICYALAVIALTYWLVRLRVQRSIKKLKEQQALRTKISSDLHDDVGSILSGLAMQSQMMTYSAQPEQKEGLNEISNMSRDAMDQMRDIVWAMDSRKDKYENLVDRMRSFAEKNFSLKNITHDFTIENIDAKRFIDPEKRQAIYLIFKEAITNIIKHSNGTHVAIELAFKKNNFYMLVHDNGLVSKENNTNDGQGLDNMKMRAGKIGGILTVGVDKGFWVELIV